MTPVLHCPQGHRWERRGSATSNRCPVCGSPTVGEGENDGTLADSPLPLSPSSMESDSGTLADSFHAPPPPSTLDLTLAETGSPPPAAPDPTLLSEPSVVPDRDVTQVEAYVPTAPPGRTRR